MSEFVKLHNAFKWRAGIGVHEDDGLAVEEPLEIRLGGHRFTLTMRTPGHDEELAAGFLLAEGFINSREELGEVRRLRDSQGRPEPNALDVILNVPAAGLSERLRRNFAVSSSCGVCGKTSIEALERRIAPIRSEARMAAGMLFKMPTLMREAQEVFSTTGGLHAAALFEFAAVESQQTEVRPGAASNRPLLSPLAGAGDDSHMPSNDQNVRLMVLREDVGRHNAVDKVVGHSLLNGTLFLHLAAQSEVERNLLDEADNGEGGTEADARPKVRMGNKPHRAQLVRDSSVRGIAMMVSGRLSFEIVQKAAAAGIAILCAVSAPSSLAVELADEVGMTLVGFLREPSFNIYTGEHRILW